MTTTNERRIAILIDGDNAQPKMLDYIIEEVAKKGQVTIRRIYGDWTNRNMNGWKELLNAHAIQPMQQFAYTKGKNATDSTLIIDAMDILHSKLVDGFAIVSSDSDYTRLATRIREEGIFVMGVGEKKTPSPFVKATELFIYTENLGEDDDEEEQTESAKSKPKRAKRKPDKAQSEKLVRLMKRAYYIAADENDTAYLGKLGEALRKLDSGFDVREYGFRTLTSLVKGMSDHYEIIIPDGSTSIYIRMRGRR
jgi:hypothetical protein